MPEGTRNRYRIRTFWRAVYWIQGGLAAAFGSVLFAVVVIVAMVQAVSFRDTLAALIGAGVFCMIGFAFMWCTRRPNLVLETAGEEAWITHEGIRGQVVSFQKLSGWWGSGVFSISADVDGRLQHHQVLIYKQGRAIETVLKALDEKVNKQRAERFRSGTPTPTE